MAEKTDRIKARIKIEKRYLALAFLFALPFDAGFWQAICTYQRLTTYSNVFIPTPATFADFVIGVLTMLISLGFMIYFIMKSFGVDRCV